jgi:hypothetical protein
MPLGTQRPSPLEAESSSTIDAVPTAVTSATHHVCSPQKLDINYTHHHILSFNTASSSSDSAFTDQIQALKLSVMSNRPGSLTAPDSGRAGDVLSPKAAEELKVICINGVNVQYSASTLPEPPTLSYKMHELDRLLHDWDLGNQLVVTGVGIPVCNWQKMYSRTRPQAWKKIKDQWIKYKFIVGGLKSHNGDIERFWEYLFAAAPVAPAESGDRRLTMKAMSDILRKIRTERNKTDTELARMEFSSEEFSKIFGYKKGGKTCVMRREQDIGRCYRKIKKTAVYWDEDDEAIVEDGEESE